MSPYLLIILVSTVGTVLVARIMLQGRRNAFPLWLISSLVFGLGQILTAVFLGDDVYVSFMLGFIDLNPSRIRPNVLEMEILAAAAIPTCCTFLMNALFIRLTWNSIFVDIDRNSTLPQSSLFAVVLLVSTLAALVISEGRATYLVYAMLAVGSYLLGRAYGAAITKSSIFAAAPIASVWLLLVIAVSIVAKSRSLSVDFALLPFICTVASVAKGNRQYGSLIAHAGFAVTVSFLLSIWKFSAFSLEHVPDAYVLSVAIENIISRFNLSATAYLYIFTDGAYAFSANHSVTTQALASLVPFGRSVMGLFKSNENELFEDMTGGVHGGWAVSPLVSSLHATDSGWLASIDVLIATIIFTFVFKIAAKILRRDRIFLLTFYLLYLTQESTGFINNLCLRILPVSIFLLWGNRTVLTRYSARWTVGR